MRNLHPDPINYVDPFGDKVECEPDPNGTIPCDFPKGVDACTLIKSQIQNQHQIKKARRIANNVRDPKRKKMWEKIAEVFDPKSKVTVKIIICCKGGWTLEKPSLCAGCNQPGKMIRLKGTNIIYVCCDAAKNFDMARFSHEVSHVVGGTKDILGADFVKGVKDGKITEKDLPGLSGDVEDGYSYEVDWKTEGRATEADYQADTKSRYNKIKAQQKAKKKK